MCVLYPEIAHTCTTQAISCPEFSTLVDCFVPGHAGDVLYWLVESLFALEVPPVCFEPQESGCTLFSSNSGVLQTPFILLLRGSILFRFV